MTTTVLVVGDPHFQISNIPEVEMFIERMTSLAEEKQPDIILIAGDLLHTHERLHTTALNKAYDFINIMRNISKTYVLVGNHDMICNQNFLNTNHWMNGMKDWDNTVIVDKIISETINNVKLIFSPYVPPGRFEEALNTYEGNWNDANCIFAHQEFAGCKMGAIVSVEGDRWPLTNPHVVSGHIHSRQIPQENIYYTGSAMQHAFGESEKNIIAYLTFHDGISGYNREEIDLGLPRKKIVYMDVATVDDYEVPETEDKIKMTVSGVYDQFKAFKKTKKYKTLLEKGVKVVFKPKKVHIKQYKESIVEGCAMEEEKEEKDDTDFNTILMNIVNNQKNPYLSHAFELVVNNREIKDNDVLFLD